MKLSDSITSQNTASSGVAATPNSVNYVYNIAIAANTNANNAMNRLNADIIYIGENSSATASRDKGAIAIGSNALATDEWCIAIGRNARAATFGAIAIGRQANAGNQYSIAIGENSWTYDEAVAVGSGSYAGMQPSVAIGPAVRIYGKDIECYGSAGLGVGLYIYGTQSIAIGSQSNINSHYSIGIGSNVKTIANYSIGIGRNISTNNTYSVAIGENISTNGSFNVAIGRWANCRGNYGVAIGGSDWVDEPDGDPNYALATNYSVAVGSRAQGMSWGVSIGFSAISHFGNSVVIGAFAIASDGYGMPVAIGRSAASRSTSGIAIGGFAAANKTYSIAIGYYAQATTDKSLQLGNSQYLSQIVMGATVIHSSDQRDKADITPISDSAVTFLNKIKAISYVRNQREKYIAPDDELSERDKEFKAQYGFCSYDKEAHAKGTKKGERKRVGVIAQEVQQAMKEVYGDISYANLVYDNFFDMDPDSIPDDVENQLAVNYEGFIPFLIKAVQELSSEIDKLKSTINGNNTNKSINNESTDIDSVDNNLNEKQNE